MYISTPECNSTILENVDKTEAFSSWNKLSQTEEPLELLQAIQKVWNGVVESASQADLLARSDTTTDQACLLSACVDHSGYWLNAPPFTAVRLRLNDEMIRISVDTILGARTCEPHTCPCGKTVDARGLRCLSCRKSAARYQRHSNLNDIISRAVKRAQIPAVKELVGLSRLDGKRPDGAALNSLGKEKSSHLRCHGTRHICAVTCRRHCNFGRSQSCYYKKDVQVSVSDRHQLFVPVPIETGGTRDIQAIEFIEELGKRIMNVTNELLETQYLFQRISIAIQWGNVGFFRNIFWRLLEPSQPCNFSKLN